MIDPDEALAAIRAIKGAVDEWKIGKLNHFPAIEARVDWRSFLAAVERELAGEDVYIKKDLLAAAGRR